MNTTSDLVKGNVVHVTLPSKGKRGFEMHGEANHDTVADYCRRNYGEEPTEWTAVSKMLSPKVSTRFLADVDKATVPVPGASKAATVRNLVTESKTEKSNTGGFDPSSTISMKVSSNPKREGSKSHARFELYRDGMTVQEAIAAGLTGADFKNDVDKGFIAIA